MKLKERIDPRSLQEIGQWLKEKQAKLRKVAQEVMSTCLTTEARRCADSVEWATEPLHEDIQVAFLDNVNVHLAQIEAALRRLAHGEHGLCHECEMFIGLARLLVLPFALRCEACQMRTELQASQGGEGNQDEITLPTGA